MGPQETRLARAAAALAEAEGVVGVGSPQRGPTPATRRSTIPDGASEGRPVTPPPDDPQSKGAEADPFAVARAIVLRQLALAPRSRAQLEKKLRERGCPDEVAEQVLDRMTDVGLVDDEAYAELLVRSKQATRGLARKALAHELRKQGIDGDVADEALSQVGHEDERDKAEQLVAKKMRSMHGLDADTQARRLAGMLARKGYSGEIAWPVIRDAISRAAEHQRD